MKKHFIFLSMAAVFTATQVNAQKGFSLSIKAAPQFSMLYNSNDNDESRYETKATFNAGFGIGAAYNFTPNTGIGVDVQYSLQGQKYELNGTEYNQKVDYVKIPLLFTYNSNPLKPLSFIGKIGPQVSIVTSSKLNDKDGNKLIADTKDKYSSATFGGVALAGAQYRLSSNTFLTTAVRFDYDFTNAEDEDYPGYNTARANTYNSTIGLEVGLKFMLK